MAAEHVQTFLQGEPLVECGPAFIEGPRGVAGDVVGLAEVLGGTVGVGRDYVELGKVMLVVGVGQAEKIDVIHDHAERTQSTSHRYTPSTIAEACQPTSMPVR